MKQGKKELFKCGSLGYIAPEILRDQGYDCSSDIFGAGVILYAMLTARSLFNEQENYSLKKQNFDCKIDFDHSCLNHLSVNVNELL